MNFVFLYSAAFITGILASLGLGGGMILILYLTIFAGVAQFDAQGVNLIFFIPIALLSLIIHTRNKLVKWKLIIPSILLGSVSAALSSYIASGLKSQTLTKLFAAVVLISGIRELFTKPKN
ncbi:MAG: TSUP family transporter [Porcipelethomonas sp.]